MDAEVSECCCLDAVQTVAIVHIVEVHVEDLLFRVLLLKPVCNDDLLDLPCYRDVSVMEDGLTCKLLCQSARSANAPSEKWVDKESCYDAAEIDGTVAEESLIFRGNERLDGGLGNVRQLFGQAILSKVH